MVPKIRLNGLHIHFPWTMANKFQIMVGFMFYADDI